MIKAMTVKELIEFLSKIDENWLVIKSSGPEESYDELCEDDIFIDYSDKRIIL